MNELEKAVEQRDIKRYKFSFNTIDAIAGIERLEAVLRQALKGEGK